MINLLALLTVELYNLTLLAGTAYLVLQYNWSPWWFVLTVLLLGNARSNKNGNKET